MPKKWRAKVNALAEASRTKLHAWRTGFPSFLLEAIYPVLFAVALPISFFVAQKNSIAYLDEIKYVLLLYAIAALLIHCLNSFLLKTKSQRLLATLILIYVFMEDYETRVVYFIPLTKMLFPVATPFDVLPSAIFAIFLVALTAWLVRLCFKVTKRLFAEEKSYVVLRVMVAFVFVYTLITLAAYLNEQKTLFSFRHAHSIESEVTKNPNRDIYYIVFDRYANSESLSNYYNFDNSEFIESLRSSGMYVKDAAYSNYQFTAPSVASTLDMNYHSKINDELKNEKYDNHIPYRKIIDDPLLYRYLREANVSLYQVSSWWNPTRNQKAAVSIAPSFDATVLGQKSILNEFESLTIRKGIFLRFLRAGVGLPHTTIAKIAPGDDQRSVTLSQLGIVADLARQSDQNHPRFIFAHFIVPHPEYVFAKDGGPSPFGGDDDFGLPREDKYVNQLQFLNKKIGEMIKEIKASSKTEPIIVIQSDEGPYPRELLAHPDIDWRKASEDVVKEKFGILAAYNLPGVKIGEAEQKQINSANIFRFILNRYMGTQLDYLPDCSYAYNSNEPFRFYDVTPLLREPDNRCKELHST